jgi:hypothetical protein
MACPGETLGSPWPPLAIRPWKDEKGGRMERRPTASKNRRKKTMGAIFQSEEKENVIFIIT